MNMNKIVSNITNKYLTYYNNKLHNGEDQSYICCVISDDNKFIYNCINNNNLFPNNRKIQILYDLHYAYKCACVGDSYDPNIFIFNTLVIINPQQYESYHSYDLEHPNLFIIYLIKPFLKYKSNTLYVHTPSRIREWCNVSIANVDILRLIRKGKILKFKKDWIGKIKDI